MEEVLYTAKTFAGAFWRRRWWALVTAIIVGGLGTAVVMRLPAVYEANARVYVDTQSILNPLMSGLAIQPNVEQQVSMMARTLLTRPNLEKVARMSDLDLRASTAAERDATLELLNKKIRFSASGANNLYSIAYTHGDPQTARKVVQSLLSIFVESNLGDKRRDSEQARKFIDDQIKLYEQRLVDSENAIKEFKIRNMSVMPSLSQDSVSKQSEITNRLTQARMDLREAENLRDELKRQISGESPTFALASEIPANPSATAGSGFQSRTELDERIELLRKRGDDLLTRFTEQHPEYVNNMRVLAELEKQREQQLKAQQVRAGSAPKATNSTGLTNNPVYQQLRVTLADAEGQVASLRARVSSLESQLTQARSVAQSIPKVEAELTQLNRDYEVNKRNYDQLVSRRESAKLSGEMEAASNLAEFKVIDPPRVGSQPVSPNRPLLLAATLIGSIVAGIAAALARDVSISAVYDLRALRKISELPVLGVVSPVRSVRDRRLSLISAASFFGASTLYILVGLAVLASTLVRTTAG
jgi:polysaccharide chain length determinant protein (PEP-CTERM system associated)